MSTDHPAEPPRSATPPGPRSEQLRADCARCCALCCVAPAFDAAQGFGFNKPARTPCVNLSAELRCSIHDELRASGFPGCAAFDCLGAGQRVTRLFGGESWKKSPELARRMFEAYLRYRSLHELLVLLGLAIERAPPFAAAPLRELQEVIEHLCESGAAMSKALSIEAVRAQAWKLIREAVPLYAQPFS
jgi:hypothetical protein